MLKSFSIAVLLLFVFVCTVVAEDGSAEKITVEKTGAIELLKDASVDIKAVLDSEGFTLPGNIGKLIDEARMSGDPADSWPVVMAIGWAEMESEAKSDLVTAKVLFDEAVEKALRSSDALSLVMASHIMKGLHMEDEANALFEQSQSIASANEGEKASDYTFDLEVNNYWDEAADVYLDDWYLGTVPAGYYMYFNDLPVGYYYLYAYGVWSGDYGIVEVEGDSWSFTSVDLW